jgi:hypothetical protein
VSFPPPPSLFLKTHRLTFLCRRSATAESRVLSQRSINTGRCKICGYKRPLSHYVCWTPDNVVRGVGSTCAAKITAALNLRFCDKDDLMATYIDAAQRALTM